jgi:hypothetical protein
VINIDLPSGPAITQKWGKPGSRNGEFDNIIACLCFSVSQVKDEKIERDEEEESEEEADEEEMEEVVIKEEKRERRNSTDSNSSDDSDDTTDSPIALFPETKAVTSAANPKAAPAPVPTTPNVPVKSTVTAAKAKAISKETPTPTPTPTPTSQAGKSAAAARLAAGKAAAAAGKAAAAAAAVTTDLKKLDAMILGTAKATAAAMPSHTSNNRRESGYVPASQQPGDMFIATCEGALTHRLQIFKVILLCCAVFHSIV